MLSNFRSAVLMAKLEELSDDDLRWILLIAYEWLRNTGSEMKPLQLRATIVRGQP